MAVALALWSHWLDVTEMMPSTRCSQVEFLDFDGRASGQQEAASSDEHGRDDDHEDKVRPIGAFWGRRCEQSGDDDDETRSLLSRLLVSSSAVESRSHDKALATAAPN